MPVYLYTQDQETEVVDLAASGAARLPWEQDPGDDFVVLADRTAVSSA